MPERVPARRQWTAAGLTLVLAAVIVAGLVTADSRPPDRVRSLASRLRCPVCQAESVADSPSETAREMTTLIAEQVEAGRSDEEILAFFRQRYGDWILLDPPVSGRTWPVWVLPPLALVVAVVVLVGRRRGRPDGELEPEQRAAVAAERRRLEAAMRDEPAG